MALKVTRVDTWAVSIPDKPGGLAEKLGALAQAGVNLEFMVARRAPERPGSAVMFCTPIKGAKQVKAARQAGLAPARSMHTLRVEGADRKGQAALIVDSLAAAGLNLRGLSAAALGKRFVVHLALDTVADAAAALRILKEL